MATRPQHHQQAQEHVPEYAQLNNLVSEKLGGRILFATDDWFAVAENMLKESVPEWREGEFTECGKWMDGWETRRKRKPGHDWCIIKLGIPGIIQGVDSDTSWFTGNYIPKFSLQAAVLTPEEEAMIPERVSKMGTEACDGLIQEVEKLNSQEWEYLVNMKELRPGYQDTCHNYFPCDSQQRWTHVRLNIYPDGGIARLKVFGTAAPDWREVPDTKLIDLACVENGCQCVSYSDAHYGHPRNLLNPGRGVNMGDGWETARRLDRPPILIANEAGVLQVPTQEWAVLKLGHPGHILKIEVDTCHFKGNFPDSIRIEGRYIPSREDQQPIGSDDSLWATILPPQKLGADARHFYEGEIQISGPFSHVRVVIAPDGGISRVRLHGNIFKTVSKL